MEWSKDLSLEDQATYYSHWFYGCIHVLLSIPDLQTKDALAAKLGLPGKKVGEVLQFLVDKGLALKDGQSYKIGPRHLHLPENSPLVVKNHSDWRTRALVSLGNPLPEDMHYSVVFTLSREDVEKIRARLVQLVVENLKIVAPSKEECAYAFTMDFFEI